MNVGRFIRYTLLIVFLHIEVTSLSSAQGDRFGIFEKTGQYMPADAYLLNEDSVWVRLGDLIDRPTLISFVYYRCPGLCSPVMDGIAEIIDKTDLRLGKDYQVITISVDYRESISLARDKKRNYLKTIHTGAASRFWQFYVTDSQTIHTLTSAAGWEFKRSGNDFVHAAGTLLITPRRMISQYFYGTFILPMHFHMAVDDARKEMADLSRVKDQKYCYNYKPEKNRLYSLIVSSAGIGILLAAAILFIWLSLTKRLNYPSQHSGEHGPLQIR